MGIHIPKLKTQEDCAALYQKLGCKKAVALWATTQPRPTTDILIELHTMLLERGYQAVLFLRANSVAAFLAQCPEGVQGHTYILDDMALLAHCPFITLLISNDYCIRQKPPAAFPGKVLLLPHNINAPNPHANNFWADYLVTPNTSNIAHEYSFLPNCIKINQTPFLAMIPCGYPKLDLLMQDRAEYGAGPHRLVAFFPGVLWYSMGEDTVKASRALNRWQELIDEFFAAYPDWKFALRPYKQDRGHPLFQALHSHYANHPNFIYDTGEDNKRYLVGADIFITDYSAVEVNFAFATLRPRIALSLDEQGPDGFVKDDIGYTTYSGQQAVQAIGDALNSLDSWEKEILRLRNTVIPNAGKCYDYLCEHIEDILLDRLQPEWVIFDKGDTPFDRVKDWVRLFSGSTGLTTQGIIPKYYSWSREVLGKDPKIGLAFLRYSLKIMPALDTGQSQYKISGLNDCLGDIFTYTPPRHILGLLRYMHKKHPDNRYVATWLLVATLCWDATPERMQHAMGCLSQNDLMPTIAKALCSCQLDNASLLSILDRLMGIPCPQMPSELFFIYYLLLLDKKRHAEADMTRINWQKVCSGNSEYSKQYDLAVRLLKNCGRANLPNLFSTQEKTVVDTCGVALHFESKQQADILLAGTTKMQIQPDKEHQKDQRISLMTSLKLLLRKTAKKILRYKNV